MEIHVKRINKAFHYEATTPTNIKVQIDSSIDLGGENKGARPMELVLMGLAGCTSIDFGLILKKQKQELEDYSITVSAVRNENTAKNFKSIHLHFMLKGKLDAAKIERAIALTLTKYCSVALSLSKDVKITSSFDILGKDS